MDESKPKFICRRHYHEFTNEQYHLTETGSDKQYEYINFSNYGNIILDEATQELLCTYRKCHHLFEYIVHINAQNFIFSYYPLNNFLIKYFIV